MRPRPTVQTQLATAVTDPFIEVVNVRFAALFPVRLPERRNSSIVWAFALASVVFAPRARAEMGRVPPPRPELDAGPAPLPRAPEHARKPLALVAELASSFPTCQDGQHAGRCTALAPALAGGVAALYRPVPYFAFGGALSVARARGVTTEGRVAGELVAAGATGRVYFYESGVFDPYLELELGYGSFRTMLARGSGVREQASAFGPMARVGGGMDFVVLPALELGGAVAFRHLLLERGAVCEADACRGGEVPSGAMLGAFIVGVRATLVLGAPL